MLSSLLVYVSRTLMGYSMKMNFSVKAMAIGRT